MQALRVAERARKLLDAFLLREPEKVAGGRNELQQELTGRYHAAARRRIRVAGDLQSNEAVAALVLYREAAMLLIAALGQTSSSDKVVIAPTSVEAWKAFDAYPKTLIPPSPPDSLAKARHVLTQGDPMAPDTLEGAAVVDAATSVAETVDWLSSAIEPRTPSEIRSIRVLRLAGVGLAVLFVAYLLVTGLLRSKNLALGMPVTASSQRPGTPVASGVVNGDVEHTFGVHTNIEQNPWVRIDLGASVPIHEVRVYNRGDANQAEVIGLVLELSDDDNAYTAVEECKELFTRENPWIIKLDGRHARFVRLYLARQGYIGLSEIEVY